jgi:predicted nucleic acid-binding protein
VEGETVDGYILDTNIISIVCRSSDQHYAAVRANLRATAGPVFLPIIALAEIEFGLAKSTGYSEAQARALQEFLRRYSQHLGIDDNTVEPYAHLRAQLWRDHGTVKETGKGHKERLPEELFDRVSGQSLGIDERDLLIAAVAAQYSLVLATNDSGQSMQRIREAAEKLEIAGDKAVHLRIEYWPK